MLQPLEKKNSKAKWMTVILAGLYVLIFIAVVFLREA